MLMRAVLSPNVTYQLQQGAKLAFPDRWFDVVTLAGSWSYCRSQAMLNEIVRVCRPGALVVLYDFDTQVDTVVPDLLGIPVSPARPQDYNHELNLSGLLFDPLRERSCRQSHLHIQVTFLQLGFLLLANAHFSSALVNRFGTEDLPECIAEEVEARLGERYDQLALPTKIYTTVYQMT